MWLLILVFISLRFLWEITSGVIMERFEWHRLDTAVLKVFSSTLPETCSCIRQHEERYHQLTPESCRRSFPLFSKQQGKNPFSGSPPVACGSTGEAAFKCFVSTVTTRPKHNPRVRVCYTCFIYIIRGCPITKEHALLMAHLELSIASGRRSRSPSLIIWLSHLLWQKSPIKCLTRLISHLAQVLTSEKENEKCQD